MSISTLIGLLGYLFLSTGMILCAVLVLLTLFLHFYNNGSLENLSHVLAHIQTGFLAAAVLVLAILLQQGAYQYEVVFNAVENSMPPFQRLGGLWSGQASSLLFWSFLTSCAISTALLINKQNKFASSTKTILLILQITLLFFLVPDTIFSNPFNKTWMLPSGEIYSSFFPPDDAILAIAVDGQGMNPGLRHIAMLLHPPALYLGLIGFLIPYAFFIDALYHKKNPFDWVGKLIPVVLFAWTFLTIGMLLGSWWAYTIQGWGGYWGWDAVEISGLIPWLLSFGLIHSIRMQMRGFDYRKWITFFTFAIVVISFFGILITRSGMLESMHAYTSGTMGLALTVLILIHICAAMIILFIRSKSIYRQSATNERNKTDVLIRLFNFCLVTLVLICLIGQTFPLTSQVIMHRSQSFSIHDYERMTSPIFLMLILLSALCAWDFNHCSNRWFYIALALSVIPPIIMLFSTSLYCYAALGFWIASFLLLSWLITFWREFLLPIILRKKNKARLSVIVIHIGLAILTLGILGVENLTNEYEGQGLIGNQIKIAECDLGTYSTKNYIDLNGNVVFELPIQLSCTSDIKKLRPSIIHYTKVGTMIVQPDLNYGWLQDTQILLESISNTNPQVFHLRLRFLPLMSWIWIGGGVMVFAQLVSLFSKN